MMQTSRLIVTFRNDSHDITCTSNEKLLPWAVEFYLSTAYCSDLSVLYEFVIWHMKHSTNSTCFKLKLFCLTLKNNTQQLYSDICYAFHIMLYNSLQNSWSLCHGSWSAHHFWSVVVRMIRRTSQYYTSRIGSLCFLSNN